MKAKVIDQMVEDNPTYSKAGAERALNDSLQAIGRVLSHDGKVQLVGFGTFSRKYQESRNARNPQTGEAIRTQPGFKVRFKPSKELA